MVLGVSIRLEVVERLVRPAQEMEAQALLARMGAVMVAAGLVLMEAVAQVEALVETVAHQGEEVVAAEQAKIPLAVLVV